jgi:hypothetical protein
MESFRRPNPLQRVTPRYASKGTRGEELVSICGQQVEGLDAVFGGVGANGFEASMAEQLRTRTKSVPPRRRVIAKVCRPVWAVT